MLVRWLGGTRKDGAFDASRVSAGCVVNRLAAANTCHFALRDTRFGLTGPRVEIEASISFFDKINVLSQSLGLALHSDVSAAESQETEA
jgi:hypothetical protein